MPTNGIKCLTCNTEIISQHGHDFVCCQCPAESETRVCVDGGPNYKRRVFGKTAKWEELDSGEKGPENLSQVGKASEADEAASAKQGPFLEGEPEPDASVANQLDFAFEQTFKAGYDYGSRRIVTITKEAAWQEWSKQAGFGPKEK
jgi:hypothetical protein